MVEAGGPVHALAIREAGQVGVPVHTHVHVVAPHTQPRCAVAARLVLTAGDRTMSNWFFLSTSRTALLTRVDAGGLLLLTLLLRVPPAPVRQLVAALAGVQVLANLPGSKLRAASQVVGGLDVLHLGALGACVAAVATPDAAQGGG